MDDFSLQINWIGLPQVAEELMAVVLATAPEDFAEVRGAFGGIVDEAEETYIRYLNGSPIPGKGTLPHPYPSVAKGVYQRALGHMAWAIGTSAEFGKTLEDGAEAYDMKKNLATAPRARRAKDGHLYLIIPFRHGAPHSKRIAAMPKEVYSLALQMDRSRRVGAPFTRASGTGYTVPAWAYHWAGKSGRLSKKQLAAAGLSEADAKRYSGLVRMGSVGQTSYLTFRVMSEKSSAQSWIRPARPGFAPLEIAMETAWNAGQPELWKAFQADLNRLVFGS